MAAPVLASSSLASLRQKVADRLNLLVQGTVLANPKTDATLSSFYDDTLSGEFENTYRNAFVVMTSGTAGNIGQFRQVAGNKDGLFSFKRGWPAVPTAGDTYDLYRRFNPPAIRSAINWAIDNVFPWIYVRFEQEVPESTNTMEYPYPSLSSPAVPTALVNGGAGTSWDYALVARNAAGDAPPSSVVIAISGATPNVTLTWTAVSNTDSYLVLRRVTGNVPWLQVAVVPSQAVGTVQTYTDTSASTSSYTPAASAPPLVDLRQLWRRSNPLVTTGGVTTGNTLPPTYQEMRGSIWADLGKTVRIRWQPTNGQYLCFVGYARFAPLIADTDSVDASRLPDELLIRGAAKILYENLAAGEASSSTIYFERQAKMWTDQYEAKRREYAMEQIGREQHPPESHIVRGPNVGVGPINPYGG